MTERQIREVKRASELLRRIVPVGSRVILRSDEDRAYPQVMRGLRDRRFRHETTSSRASRTPQNPLFPVNLADLLMRHCSAIHKRETIAIPTRAIRNCRRHKARYAR